MILVVGVIFLVLGVVDVYQGAAPLFTSGRLASDDALVLCIGIAALVGGVNVLRGRSWARWLLAGWMAVHVAISAGRPAELGAHLAIFGFIAFLLFRSRASAHFKPAATQPRT